MLTGGHIAASYLLAEYAKTFGIPLTNNEIVGVVIAGNIIDLDFITGFFNGKTGEAHHQNITHTPLGIFILWTGISLIFNISTPLSLLLLLVMFMHLILDEVGYWAYKLKIYRSSVNPQINWLYPLSQFHKNKLMTNNKNVLKYYLFHTWPIALLEAALVLLAIFVFISSNN